MRIVLTATILTILTGTAAAQEFEKDRQAAEVALIEEMEKLAVWCQKNRLLAERNATYEAILGVAPDHKKARRMLRYRRKRDGTWEQKGYRKPKNANPKALEECARRRADIAQRSTERLVALVKKHGLEGERLAAVLEPQLAVDPESELIRKALGHVQVDGQWMSPEAARAAERRIAIEKGRDDALKSVPTPEDAAVPEELAASGLTWHGVKTSAVTVFTTTSRDEAEACARHIHALPAFVKSLFGTSRPLPGGFRFYLVKDGKEAKKALAALPDFAPHAKEYANRLGGLWNPSGAWHVYVREKDASRRLDACVRQAADYLIGTQFGFTRKKRPWAFESMGLLVLRQYCGTAATWFIGRDKKGSLPKLAVELGKKGADWKAKAMVVLGEGLADPRPLDGKNHGDLTAEDALFGSVYLQWVLETQPKAADYLDILGRKGHGSALASGLGMQPPEALAAFRKWLGS